MTRVRYPALFQINTRVWLTEIGHALRRAATLDDIPDAVARLAAQGFDWVWLLSVWQTGLAGQQVSRRNPEWRKEFQETLPDLQEDDIAGSGFAITGYTVPQALGGDAALARLRERLRNSVLAEALLIAVVYGVGVLLVFRRIFHARFCTTTHENGAALGYAGASTSLHSRWGYPGASCSQESLTRASSCRQWR